MQPGRKQGPKGGTKSGAKRPQRGSNPERDAAPAVSGATTARGRKLASIAHWDALRRRYPVGSHWELLRQGSGVLAANLLVARGLVRGELRPWELVVLVALEAIAFSLVSWMQLLFVPKEARPEAEEKRPALVARLGTLAFGLFWLLCVYGLVFGFFLRDLSPFLAALREPLDYFRGSAIRWPLAVALASLALDALADRQHWRQHGGTFVSTPAFTAMARWLTLILGGIPFFVPFAAGGVGVAQLAKWMARRYGAPRGGKLPAAILVLPVLAIGLMMLVGWLMQAGALGWTIGYVSAKFLSEMLILAVPLIAERASREERAALESG
jgi:hypothetical protein